MRQITNYQHYLIDTKTNPSLILNGEPRLFIDYLPDKDQWNYKFDSSRLNDLLTGVMAGLCQMAENRAPFSPRFRSVSIREIENFLRIRNDRPAFEVTAELEEVVKKCLDRWASRGIFLFLKDNLGNKREKWPENYLFQVQLMKFLFDEQLRPLLGKEGLKVDFIALEGHSVVIKLSQEQDYIFLEGIKWFLEEKIEKVSLNIVAEE